VSTPILVLTALLAQSAVHVPQVSPPAPLTIGDTFTIHSRVLNEVRRINVYTPPGTAKDERLPVLYMPDGGMGEDFLHVAGLVQVSVVNGTMRPFLLVGIENTDRRRDLTPPTSNAEDKKIAPRAGGSAAFRRFLRTELIPAIDARYRTLPERVIVGESFAGLFVVETALAEPDLFDTYIAFDPSLWWDDERLLKAAPERLRAITRPLVLFVAGGKEAENLMGRMAATLRSQAPQTLRWTYESMPGETHATIFHPAALKAFRAVFAPAPPVKR
jgi:hypothetical protein